MNVGGREISKRTDARAALDKAISEVVPGLGMDATAPIGSIGGFPVRLRREKLGDALELAMNGRDHRLAWVYPTSAGKGAFRIDADAVRAAENYVASLERERDAVGARRQERTQTLAAMQAQIGRPFEKGPEIAALRDRIGALERELAPEDAPSAAAAPSLTAAPDEGGGDDMAYQRPGRAPVAEISGDEFGTGLTTNELRERVRDFMGRLRDGAPIHNAGTGWDIRVTTDLLKLHAASPEILERGVLIGTESPRAGSRAGLLAVHTLGADVNMGGHVYPVVATVREFTGGRFYYALNQDRMEVARWGRPAGIPPGDLAQRAGTPPFRGGDPAPLGHDVGQGAPTDKAGKLAQGIDQLLARIAPGATAERADSLEGGAHGAYFAREAPEGTTHVIAWSLASPAGLSGLCCPFVHPRPRARRVRHP